MCGDGGEPLLGQQLWCQAGFGEGSDTLPQRFLTEPSTSAGSEGHVCELDKMLVEYYDARGWVNGVVPESKLKALAIL